MSLTQFDRYEGALSIDSGLMCVDKDMLLLP